MFDEIVNNIANNAERANAVEQGDYIGDDGLLYCGKCNTRKQCRVELFGKERIMFCTCKCRKEQLEAERIEQEKREKWLRIERLRRLGFPDAEMQKWTFKADNGQNADIMQVAKNYVDNFAEMKKRGKGLLLFGEVGTGKSFAAACIANALIDKIGRAHV